MLLTLHKYKINFSPIVIWIFLFLLQTNSIPSDDTISRSESFCDGASFDLYRSSCSSPKRILVILQSELMPAQIGSDKRAFHILEELQSFQHYLYVASLWQSSSVANEDDKRFMQRLRMHFNNKSLLYSKNVTLTYRYVRKLIMFYEYWVITRYYIYI